MMRMIAAILLAIMGTLCADTDKNDGPVRR